MKLVIIISLSFVFLKCLIVPVHCTKGKHPIDDNESERYKHWNDDDKKNLLKIFYETNTGEKSHAERIRKRWDELHAGNRTTSRHNLYTRLTKWIEKGEADRLLPEKDRLHKEYEPRLKKTKWTPEMEENVLTIHKQTNFVRWGQSRLMKELWDTKHPDHSEVTGHQLIVKVRDLQKKHEGKSVPANKTEGTLLNDKEKEDLLRCYYMASKNKGEKLKVMRELFIKRHPQLADSTYNELRCHLFRFRRHHPVLDRRISEEFSAANELNPSWLMNAESDLIQEESENIPKLREHNLLGDSDQYPGPDQNIPWRHHMFGESSSSGQHTFSDVSTSHQFLRPGPSGNNSGRDSAQHHSDRRQEKSSKGKQPELDLDLHL